MGVVGDESGRIDSSYIDSVSSTLGLREAMARSWSPSATLQLSGGKATPCGARAFHRRWGETLALGLDVALLAQM